MQITNEFGFTRMDKLNMMSCNKDIKKLKESITIIGAIEYMDADKETGEVKPVGAIKTDNGDIYGFTSQTLIETLPMIIDAFNDGVKSITLTTVTGQSNAGRTFYQFKILNMVE